VFAGVEPDNVFQWRKHLFDLTRGQQREVIPVRRIYLLDYGAATGFEFVPPLSAVAALSSHSFVEHRRMNEVATAAHLRDCSLVAGAVPFYRLFRRQWLADLPDLVHCVETDISGAGK